MVAALRFELRSQAYEACRKTPPLPTAIIIWYLWSESNTLITVRSGDTTSVSRDINLVAAVGIAPTSTGLQPIANLSQLNSHNLVELTASQPCPVINLIELLHVYLVFNFMMVLGRLTNPSRTFSDSQQCLSIVLS